MTNNTYATVSIKGKTFPVWVGEDGRFNLQIIQNANRGICGADTVLNLTICEHLQDDPVIATFWKEGIFDVTGFATKSIQMLRNTKRKPRWSMTLRGSGARTKALDGFYVIIRDGDSAFPRSPTEPLCEHRARSNRND